LPILFAQLPELAQLAQSQSSVAPLPAVKRLLRYAHFPADLAHLLSCFGLPQCSHDLLFAVPFPRHASSCSLRSEDHILAPLSTFQLSRFRVLGHSSMLPAPPTRGLPPPCASPAE